MIRTEFLIIGQGICGTLLSWCLEKAGHSFIVIDDGNKHSSSRVAAGIINPVTGRRVVQTWMIEQLLPFAWNSYQQLGKDLGIEAITQKNIIEFFPSPQMLQAFNKKLDEGLEYISMPADVHKYRNYFNYDFGYGEITPGYAVQLANILPSWKNYLEEKTLLLPSTFDQSQLEITENDILYQHIIAEKIIFCDGVQGDHNRWFRNLPFALNKGEALIIEAKDLPAENIFKKTFTLVPLNNGLFWAGASYDWDFTDALPTAAFRERTEMQLKHWIRSPFTTVDHLASIRPATVERRPFIGTHPHQPRMAIFNGMGTKGCSLAPYFAAQLVLHLTKNAPIAAEANVNRFTRLLSINK